MTPYKNELKIFLALDDKLIGNDSAKRRRVKIFFISILCYSHRNKRSRRDIDQSLLENAYVNRSAILKYAENLITE